MNNSAGCPKNVLHSFQIRQEGKNLHNDLNLRARGPSEGMQRMEVPKEPPPSQMAQKPPPPHEVKDDPCPCNTDHVLKHSGKLLKRYTTTEYIQQW
ncbi:coiled-coil domain-containing protein 200 isoform X1 [Sceloporus undulatus]|uniref:coiled-coil domain-containing protein 200 isoform X1 n=1 Tax=Sceloporus undulatus TaxID=8520 RepID=UPI001C4D590C|nr:coiled-coil domain-containing protein 200 isoform X1 [Sceloporus undulatus]